MWEEKCMGCLCNTCFMKKLCCGVDGCRRRKKCEEYYPAEVQEQDQEQEKTDSD